MLTMQDRRGNIWVSNRYDANGRVDKQTLADQTYYQFAYATDSGGMVTATTVTDPNGHQEHLTFDPVSKYPLTDTFAYGTPLAQTTTYTRETSGLVDSVTDALNRTTAFTYDWLGNVTKVTRLAGTANAVSYRFTYTSDFSQLATMTDPLGHTTTLSYVNGCLSAATDALNHSIAIQCNAAGQPTAITDALGHSATLGYQGSDAGLLYRKQGRTRRQENGCLSCARDRQQGTHACGVQAALGSLSVPASQGWLSSSGKPWVRGPATHDRAHGIRETIPGAIRAPAGGRSAMTHTLLG